MIIHGNKICKKILVYYGGLYFYGGVDEIGENKIQLTSPESSFFFDFGMDEEVSYFYKFSMSFGKDAKKID